MNGHCLDVVVIGGGPAGTTAASDLARSGLKVALVDRQGRIKPCGGAIPPKAVRDFGIPDSQIVARIRSARMIAPSSRSVDMPIDNGYVGMVDRESFDEWLRTRACEQGAQRINGEYRGLTRDSDGSLRVQLDCAGPDRVVRRRVLSTRLVIGADGARSMLARECDHGADPIRYVSAYHEIIRAPQQLADYDATRCDVVYDGQLSSDFYGWVFPHGDTVSVGVGTEQRGASMRRAVAQLRERSGLADCATIRREGAPIPLAPRRRWDNGRDVLLAGDAAGVVAPASGEGIYYAMLGGQIAAQAAQRFIATGDPAQLRTARRRFMKLHGQVFTALGMMQWFWYSNDRRRERFVRICADRDLQGLIWDAYMNKALVRGRPLVHARIFFKNIAHLSGLVPA